MGSLIFKFEFKIKILKYFCYLLNLGFCLLGCVCAYAQSLPSFPTLCDPMDCSPAGYSVYENCNGWPRPPPGNLPKPGIKPMSLASSSLHADSLPLSHWGSPLTRIEYEY